LESGQEEAERTQQAQRAQRAQLIHSALRKGGGVMERLKDRAARHHPTTLAKRLHRRLNGLPKPMVDGKRRKAFEALVRADVVALEKSGEMVSELAAHTMRAAVMDGTVGEGILPQDRKLLLDVLGQLGIDRFYRRLNLKITSDTMPAFSNIQLMEKAKSMGSGKINTVFAVKLRKPDGSAFDGVFKPLRRTEHGKVAAAIGIPHDDPQTAMRNIATVSYAKKLGFDVIADTRLALIDTGDDTGTKLGLIMERARGKPPAKMDASDLTRPDVCAEVTKLQLLDHLTGQGDRHGKNYFINIEPNGRAKVIGIDNDQCFGKDLIDPAGIQRIIGDKSCPFRGAGLPPVVDTEMERAINALTSIDIRWMLGDKLNEAEIQAAIARHQGVKIHIAHLRTNGMVIEPTQWGEPNVQQLLNAQNSYVGLRIERALAKQARRLANQANASMRPRSPLPPLANLHQSYAPRLSDEIQEHAAEANQPQRQQEAERSQRAHSSMPGEWHSQLFRQEPAERAQLMHSALRE